MASYIWPISEFDSTCEDAVLYVERFDMFLSANGVEDAAKKLLRSLAGNKPGEKSYVDLKTLLTEHLNPKPNIIAERYKFYKSKYLAELVK